MSQKFTYNTRFPAVEDLRRQAKKRIPKFAFDYLIGGCNEELNLARNENDFDNILLKPQYLQTSGE
ncbi:MAG: alpha-hydroxy-acid oxidizing protein, partial [Sphingobacterium sp.]